MNDTVFNIDPLASNSLFQLTNNFKKGAANMKRTAKHWNYEEVAMVLDELSGADVGNLETKLNRTGQSIGFVKWAYMKWLKEGKRQNSQPLMSFFKAYKKEVDENTHSGQTIDTNDVGMVQVPPQSTLDTLEPIIKDLNTAFELMKTLTVRLVEQATDIRVKEEIAKNEKELTDLRKVRDTVKNNNLGTMLQRALSRGM
jgi:hypothetical protein